jgi:hypothetical protein
MLSFIFTLMMTTLVVQADEATTTDTATCDAATAELVDVTLHYVRLDDKYENTEMAIHTWGAGTRGSSDGQAIDANWTTVIKVNPCDADDEIGIIPKKAADWSYKDGIDTDANDGADNKFIDVTKIKDGTLDSLTAYVFQGSNEVYYDEDINKADMGKLFVVYYRPNGDYGIWNNWTWDAGTGGSKDAVDYNFNLGLDGDSNPNTFKVAVFNVAADAQDNIGFIVRTEDWKKDSSWVSEYDADFTDDNGHKYIIEGNDAGNRLINVSDIKGSGSKVVFVIQNQATIYEDFGTFKDEAFKFEFKTATFERINSLSFEFNQEIEYNPETGPDKAKFSIKDSDGNTLSIKTIGYDSQKESNALFNFLVDDIDITKTYTITYLHTNKAGEEKAITSDIEIADNSAPTLQIDKDEFTVKQGAKKITRPDVKAFDDGIKITNIRAEGVVDTAKPGEYEVTYYAEDDFGNVASKTITFVVEGNVFVYWPFALIAVVVIGGASVGIIATRKKKAE